MEDMDDDIEVIIHSIQPFYENEKIEIKKSIYDKYRNKIMTAGYYADSYAIQTLSRLLKIDFTIISKNDNNQLKHDFIDKSNNNNMFLFKRGDHYELLTHSEKSFFNNAEREQIINNLAEIGKNLE